MERVSGKNRVQTASRRKTFCFWARETRRSACLLLTVNGFSHRTCFLARSADFTF